MSNANAHESSPAYMYSYMYGYGSQLVHIGTLDVFGERATPIITILYHRNSRFSLSRLLYANVTSVFVLSLRLSSSVIELLYA